LPHAPQLFTSVCVFAQAPLQFVVPPGHATMQLPAEHTWPAGHALLHVPQLNGSVCVFTHTPLHTLCVPGHAEHTPAVQV
jgi:hypothetical protein